MTWPHAFSRDFPQLHALDWILIGLLPAYDITAKLTRIIANSILETTSAMISCTEHPGKQQRPKRYRRADHGLSLFSNFSKYVLRYAIHRGWRRAIRLTSLTGRAPPKSTCGKQSKAHTDYLKNLIMETSCWCTKCVQFFTLKMMEPSLSIAESPCWVNVHSIKRSGSFNSRAAFSQGPLLFKNNTSELLTTITINHVSIKGQMFWVLTSCIFAEIES